MWGFSTLRSLYQQSSSTSVFIKLCGPGAVRQHTGEELEGERRRVQRIRTFRAHAAWMQRFASGHLHAALLERMRRAR